MSDTTPDIARTPELSANEAIAALDFHANKAAKAGNYGLHDDLHAAANLIDELQAKVELLESRRTVPMEVVFSSRYEPSELKPVRESRDDE